MIIEYAGVADRWAGLGVVHNVRAWWNVNHDAEGAVKRAALRAVQPKVKATDHLSVDPIDADTYSTPQLNALVRVRVISHEQYVERKRLASLVVRNCTKCGDEHPGNYLRMADGSEQAVCYTCLLALPDGYRTIAWVKSDGRLQV
jgi:hypothetical protein